MIPQRMREEVWWRVWPRELYERQLRRIPLHNGRVESGWASARDFMRELLAEEWVLAIDGGWSRPWPDRTTPSSRNDYDLLLTFADEDALIQWVIDHGTLVCGDDHAEAWSDSWRDQMHERHDHRHAKRDADERIAALKKNRGKRGAMRAWRTRAERLITGGQARAKILAQRPSTDRAATAERLKVSLDIDAALDAMRKQGRRLARLDETIAEYDAAIAGHSTKARAATEALALLGEEAEPAFGFRLI